MVEDQRANSLRFRPGFIVSGLGAIGAATPVYENTLLPPNVDKLIAAELIKERRFYEGFADMSTPELSLRMYESRGWSSSRRRDAGGRASIGTYTRGGKIDSDIFKEKRYHCCQLPSSALDTRHPNFARSFITDLIFISE